MTTVFNPGPSNFPKLVHQISIRVPCIASKLSENNSLQCEQQHILMVLYRSYLGGCPFRAVCYAADEMEGVFSSECITYVMECMLHAGHSALYSYCRWVITSHSPLHICICCTFYKLSTVRLFHGFVFFSSFILNHF